MAIVLLKPERTYIYKNTTYCFESINNREREYYEDVKDLFWEDEGLVLTHIRKVLLYVILGLDSRGLIALTVSN